MSTVAAGGVARFSMVESNSGPMCYRMCEMDEDVEGEYCLASDLEACQQKLAETDVMYARMLAAYTAAQAEADRLREQLGMFETAIDIASSGLDAATEHRHAAEAAAARRLDMLEMARYAVEYRQGVIKEGCPVHVSGARLLELIDAEIDTAIHAAKTEQEAG